MSSTATARPRIEYLDALRSVLMMLGVVLHSARIFDGRGGWLVHDDRSSSIVFDYLVATIHLFRLPAFFIVSGYFSWMAIGRHGVRAFIQERLARLLIPVICTGLTLNVLQLRIFGTSSVVDSWRSGDWASHLWFLIVLAAYLPLLTVSVALVRWVARVSGPVAWTLVAVAIVWPAALSAAGMILPTLIHWKINALNGFVWWWYLPYFLFGAVMKESGCLLKRVSTITRWHVLGAVACGLLLLVEGQGLALRAMRIISYGALSWLACSACFWLFAKIPSRPELWTPLSESAYTVYLFHHLLVASAGSLAVSITAPTVLKFATVCSFSLIGTYAIHVMLVSKNEALSWMFNGRPLRRTTSPQSAPARHIRTSW